MVVGAGAGGSVLTQRLARAGWQRRVPGRRAVLGPGHRLGQRRTRLAHPVLDRPAADRRQRPGPVGVQQLRPRRRRLHDPLRRVHPPVPPVRLPHPQPPTGSAPTGPSATPTSSRYYEQLEAELPVAGQDWPWGDPHRYPHHPHPVSAATARSSCAARAAAGITARVGPVAITNGRFGNRPHCIYRGFCLQGCKVNAKASPLITHIPDALAHGAEIRPDSHVSRVAGRRPHRPGHRRQLPPRRGGAPATGPGGRRRRLQHRNPAAAAALGHPPLSRTGWATTTTRSAGT